MYIVLLLYCFLTHPDDFDQINYSVIDMFRTSRCSSSGGFVHAVLCYFFHASI